MKVGIVGDASRAVAWEQHLRPHRIVREVELCAHIDEISNVDACLLIDDSDSNLDNLLQAIRRGLNCFLISSPPSDVAKLGQIQRSIQEAGVHVQFSHWPTLAPATQWMMDRMQRPTLMSIKREVSYSQFINSKDNVRHFWVDELGLCMKWIGSGIHHTEAKEVTIGNTQTLAAHIFMRFNNGSTADITIFTGAKQNQHTRILSSNEEIFECDVPSQTIRAGRAGSGSLVYFEEKTFDPAKSAEKSVLMFLKSIQMDQETAYTGYDAYRLAVQVEKIKKRLKQFG